MKNNNITLILLPLTLLVVVVVAIDSSIVYPQENMTNLDMPKFFALHHANSGSTSKINDTVYTLQFNDVSDKSILFSDIPYIIVTSVSTSDFIGNWSAGIDNFVIDAPNAVFLGNESEKGDITILELFNPVYNLDKKTLKYDITLENTASIDVPDKFGQSTLIVDSITSVNPFELTSLGKEKDK